MTAVVWRIAVGSPVTRSSRGFFLCAINDRHLGYRLFTDDECSDSFIGHLAAPSTDPAVEGFGRVQSAGIGQEPTKRLLNEHQRTDKVSWPP